jgi:hypothetical protein
MMPSFGFVQFIPDETERHHDMEIFQDKEAVL